jgi:AcrR family transcriptional regulator
MAAQSSARTHIIETAGRLFFEKGYQAVGIDTIIAEAGVAKATLYRHFPSKDDLIAAYLEEMNRLFWLWFDNAAAPHANDPKAALLAVFAALEKLVTSPQCYGCPFLMAAGEFPDEAHRGRQVALAHKRALRARVYAMTEAAGLTEPALVADTLFLLADGAFVAVRMFGVDNPAVRVAAAAVRILDCYGER